MRKQFDMIGSVAIGVANGSPPRRLWSGVCKQMVGLLRMWRAIPMGRWGAAVVLCPAFHTCSATLQTLPRPETKRTGNESMPSSLAASVRMQGQSDAFTFPPQGCERAASLRLFPFSRRCGIRVGKCGISPGAEISIISHISFFGAMSLAIEGIL